MVKLLIPFLQTKFDHQTLVGGGENTGFIVTGFLAVMAIAP